MVTSDRAFEESVAATSEEWSRPLFPVDEKCSWNACRFDDARGQHVPIDALSLNTSDTFSNDDQWWPLLSFKVWRQYGLDKDFRFALT